MSQSLSTLHSVFLSILPRIQSHGQVYFRHERCQDRKADLIAEMVAISWKGFIRLQEQGKEPIRFVSAIATFAARAVRSGRRLCGQEKPKDVRSPIAQHRRNFAVATLPDFLTLSDNLMSEALTDNTQTPVPDQVSFRCDFPA